MPPQRRDRLRPLINQRRGHAARITRATPGRPQLPQQPVRSERFTLRTSCGAPVSQLSVWANAWLAGSRQKPDDVLDALSAWAPKHSVTAYDAMALTGPACRGRMLLTGVVSLLRPSAPPFVLVIAPPGHSAIGVALPVPGDVRGLPAGTRFQDDAIAAGEALIVYGPRSEAIGLIPEFEYDGEDDLTDDDRAAEPCCTGVDRLLVAHQPGDRESEFRPDRSRRGRDTR